MERIHIEEKTIQDAVTRAAGVLRAGGVVLYPTDTLYGLGADAFSDEAVGRIYDIKGREKNKPIHCVVADLAMAEQYAELDTRARLLAERFLPGPLTLILKKKDGATGGIARDMATIGIRIPASDFCLSLARAFGPFTTTSANVSGMPSGQTVDDILTQLGTRADNVAFVADAGVLPAAAPSTVVDLSGEEVQILREGAISAADVQAVLQS